jgi:hypothetical protein
MRVFAAALEAKMPIPRMEDKPSPVIALAGFGAVIGAALGALLIDGRYGFPGIAITSLIGAIAGMVLGRAIQ